MPWEKFFTDGIIIKMPRTQKHLAIWKEECFILAKFYDQKQEEPGMT
jgi:hypothetical protein